MAFIILDRDGVINYDSPAYIKSPDEWEAIPGSLEAIAQLNRFGYRVIVVSNQSGIARGFYDLATLDEIHEKFLEELASVGGHVDEILFCPHHPDDNCACRKPKPGMIYKARDKYNIDLSKTFFIGDSLVDMQAASNASCKPILVLTGNGQKTVREHPELTGMETFADLAEAVKYITGYVMPAKTGIQK